MVHLPQGGFDIPDTLLGIAPIAQQELALLLRSEHSVTRSECWPIVLDPLRGRDSLSNTSRLLWKAVHRGC